MIDAGFSVRVAATCAEALALVAEQRPDVLVLDVVMPEISGSEVCRRLRTRDETRGIPCIAYTRYQPARFSGNRLFDRVLLQPADFPELLDAIHTLLAARTKNARSRT